MIQPGHDLYAINAPEDVGVARRAAARLAGRLGVSPADVGRAELVATEIASNLKRHAHAGGFVLLRPLGPRGNSPGGVEVLGVDTGPGIADIARTAHIPTEEEIDRRAREGGRREGLGVGLDSLKRLATTFEVFSRQPLGTVVLARIEYGARAPDEDRWRVGGISVPLHCVGPNGDAWAVRRTPYELSILLVDGLGHGNEAQRAAAAALEVFEGRYDGDLSAFLADANAAMRSTRGAAATVCRIVPRDGVVHIAGVGNIDGGVLDGGALAGFVARGGTLGMYPSLPTTRVRTLRWSRDTSTLVLSTDGVRGYFDFQAFPDLLRHDPTVIAAAIHRDQRRGGDDATVVVARGG